MQLSWRGVNLLLLATSTVMFATEGHLIAFTPLQLRALGLDEVEVGVWTGILVGVTMATALPLAWQVSNVSGWVSWEVTGIFENIGVVQEGMQSIAVPHSGVDRTGAPSTRRRWAATCGSSRSTTSRTPC